MMNSSKYCMLLLGASMAVASLALSGCESDGGTLRFSAVKPNEGETITVCQEKKDCKPSEDCLLKDGKQQCVPEESSVEEEPQKTREPEEPVKPAEPVKPEDPPPPPPPPLKAYGEPCREDNECAGGVCALDSKWGKLGGYCTRLACESKADCVGGGEVEGLCAKGLAINSMCLKKCRIGAGDCRSGFECIGQGRGAGEGVCYPVVEGYPGNSKENTEWVQCVNVKKDVGTSLSVEIPPGTSSFAFSAWMFDETARIYLGYMEAANGMRVDFSRGDSSLDVPRFPKLFLRLALAGSVTNLMMPLSPSLRPLVQPGTFTVHLVSNRTGPLCYRVLSERSPGNTIDLNLYLVGVKSKDKSRDLTIDEAKKDPDIVRMIEKLRSVYAKKGINVRVKRYYTLPPKLVKRYRIYNIDTDRGGDVSLGPGEEDSRQRELQSLFQRSIKPGTSLDDLLSVNVFLVEDIKSSGGTVGLAGAIAAAPGVHGVIDSGLIFTSRYLHGKALDGASGTEVDGASYTALIMAHELGHYLGLPHTSERIQIEPGVEPFVHDRFSDTPECDENTIFRWTNLCPDFYNLMFPIAGVGHEELSSQQVDVLKASVLTK